MKRRERLELIVVLAIVAILMTALPVFAGDGGGTYPYPAPEDPVQGLMIAGVLVSALVALITQAAKDYFSLEGQSVRFVAVATGILLSGLALAIQDGMLSDEAVKIVRLVILAVSGGFGSSGAYGLYKMAAQK